MKNPWENNSEEKKKEEVINLIEKLKKEATKQGKGRKSSRKPRKPKGDFDFVFDFMKKFPFFIVVLFLGLWLITGFYKVNPDEKAAELYFGEFYRVTDSGLHYVIPSPFGRVIKKSVTTVNKEEFGFTDEASVQKQSQGGEFFFRSGNIVRNTAEEGSMLTGDENIVDIDFEVQWRIGDLSKFLFNIDKPRLTIRKSAESAMREIIGRNKVDMALSSGKFEIEREAKQLLQEILDSYESGIEIVLLQMMRVDPPKQVINAFRDVQTAKADKEREINEAEAYRNDILPKARGEAESVIQEAEAYKREVVANAEGQAERFNKIYKEYKRSKYVTKKRMYLETMEDVYQNTDKVIIDKNVSKSGVLPYMPIDGSKK